MAYMVESSFCRRCFKTAASATAREATVTSAQPNKPMPSIHITTIFPACMCMNTYTCIHMYEYMCVYVDTNICIYVCIMDYFHRVRNEDTFELAHT